MDYGHPIRFGTFITPGAGSPQRAVRLAQRSEELGFDLATFQDHPYQPAFLDTWTLMSYVGAATERIRIAPNVLNLPLRPPAMTAKAAASLDLLTGGRFDLGLGAGAFWDAIAAMGGPRRTPGQAVDALAEGIGQIRELWNAGDRGGVRGGAFVPLTGAKRGPAPAHGIPIWIGAYKPRMLRLTGRLGDGWLPSLPFMQPGDLAVGNAAIDEAAIAAGRLPHEIVRLLNIAGTEPLQQLIDLALAEGVSTFIIGEDPSLMERFAAETAPAIREAVAADRAISGTAAPTRGARAIAARRDGIAYDEVPASLRTRTVEPGDFGYAKASATYMRGGAPGILLRPTTVEEVVEAVGFARAHPDVELGIRSGGHGISGRSTNDGGIVIDVGALDTIEVLDDERRLVRVGPGARWTDVAAALEPHGWAISSGDYGGVGVGGLATAGGIGFLGREHGLTIDHLVAAEVVLADGTVSRVSAEQDPELFWAIRGAGANVGIVVAFEFEASPVGTVAWVQLTYDASDTEEFLRAYGAVQESAPREVTTFLIVSGQGRGRGTIGQLYGVVDSDDPDRILELLQPFATLGPLLEQSVSLASYAQIMANASDAPHAGRGDPEFRSGLVEHLDDAVVADAAALVRSGAAGWFQLRAVGGAIADMPADATAYANRSANFAIAAAGGSPAFDAGWDRLARHFDGLYLSFDTRTGSELVEQAFPPATLARLRVVKARVDPTGRFSDNFAVGTTEAA